MTTRRGRLPAGLGDAAAAAVLARLAYAVLSRHPPGGAKLWSRDNHRGEPISLLEGPAVVLGALAAVAGAELSQPAAAELSQPAAAALGQPAAAELSQPAARSVAGLLLAGAGAGAFGCYDDLRGSADRRGFRGHLAALRRGEVTTGMVKLAGIGGVGLAAGTLIGSADAGPGRIADLGINAALIAGAANLLNLFDLRPGRAIKVAAAAAVGLGVWSAEGGRAAAAPAGAAAALAPEDLGERAMLGDVGANAIGAMLGAAAAAGLPRRGRLGCLAVVAGLTAASEVVSFSQVIERTSALRWLDMLGRRSEPGPGRSDPEPGRTEPEPGRSDPEPRRTERDPGQSTPAPP